MQYKSKQRHYKSQQHELQIIVTVTANNKIEPRIYINEYKLQQHELQITVTVTTNNKKMNHKSTATQNKLTKHTYILGAQIQITLFNSMNHNNINYKF